VAPDPERPGFTVWQSRVYLARRYLGEDQLVLSDRRHWRLTEAGRLAADQVKSQQTGTTTDAPPTPPVTRTRDQRSLMQRSLLSTPLLDPDERARIGLPVAEDAAIPVVIELNLSYVGGSAEAYQAFTRVWQQMMPGDPVPERFEEYVRASLSMSKLRDFVRDDQPRRDRNRVMHRIWPDFPVETLAEAR
jgi:serine protease AprX